jgi:sulfatase maturation enzyme AslB (radical SAM superfamily)
MIKEGSHLFVDGQRPVEPFKGKYAVRHADFFDRVADRARQAGMDPDDPYRLLRVELELTTACNDTCSHCGMGALPLSAGETFTDEQLAHLMQEFASVGLPSIAVTGGEPFVRPHALSRVVRRAKEHGIDISKLTTNGIWGTKNSCGRVFDKLTRNGLLDNQLFVPLLMVSIGEQTTPLESVARIVHYATTNFTDQQLNIAVSSLADPATRQHRIFDLIEVYQRSYKEEFPHDRVHSTMRVYLDNERLPDQDKVNRPGHTTVAEWMGECYDCFAPTVGAYVLPTALLKNDGRLYSCAAFDVPERLNFGSIFDTPLRTILRRVNDSAYVRLVREGGGLGALEGVVPENITQTACGSFCGSCSHLVNAFDAQSGTRTGHPSPAFVPLSVIRPGAPA